MRKIYLLDACGGCACSTSGSQTELSYRNDTITVFFSQLTKIKTILKLLFVLLMLNCRILVLIWRGTTIKERVAERGRPIFGTKLKA